MALPANGPNSDTPVSRRIRITGLLDMLRVSTQTFGLRLDDGQEIRGVLRPELIDAVTRLLGRRVLVRGMAVYQSSRRLLRIDADAILPGEAEPSIWSTLPEPTTGGLDHPALRQPQGPNSGMAAIMGKWPGDETDEEIAKRLEELS